MASQTKAIGLRQVIQSQMTKPHFKWSLAAIAILLVALITGSFLTAPTVEENAFSNERAVEAVAARYSGLAELYLVEDAANSQRVSDAASARYNGLVEIYRMSGELNSQRALEAAAARYKGLAAYYLGEN